MFYVVKDRHIHLLTITLTSSLGRTQQLHLSTSEKRLKSNLQISWLGDDEISSLMYCEMHPSNTIV